MSCTLVGFTLWFHTAQIKLRLFSIHIFKNDYNINIITNVYYLHLTNYFSMEFLLKKIIVINLIIICLLTLFFNNMASPHRGDFTRL